MSLIRLAAFQVCIVASAIASAQSWTPITNYPPFYYAGNEMLMTDGTVFVQNANYENWWKLTPDKFGSYVNGTWTELASTPGYGPLYYASQVMPDGRIFTMGGEYNESGSGVWQSQGYIYNPVFDKWTQIHCPPSWAVNGMGDTASITLPNGMLLLADPLPINGPPYYTDCLFNPATNTFNNPFNNGKSDDNDEEGLTLLPDGRVMTVDAQNAPNSEIFNPKTMHWTSLGPTPQLLADPDTWEIGPAVLRPDGTVIYFGALGQNCIFNTKTSRWSNAPDFPMYNGQQIDCEDAPACLLTNGNVLVQASPGVFNSPSFFYEWDGKRLNPVPATDDAYFDPSFVGSFLMLPTGQAMWTDQYVGIEFYNSKGAPKKEWAPTIKDYPKTVNPGQSYGITGTQFNGLSGDSAYGDDQQNQTNYPLIRITNKQTKHVFYCREYNPSTMAICTGSQIVSTHFEVPSRIETGPSMIEVVTNGIPSTAMPITVH